MNYPRYVTHKEVSAAQVSHVEGVSDGSIVVHLEGGFDSVVMAHADRKYRPHPEAGWYLIRYDDGYVSFSPKKAFEEGYSLLALDTPPDEPEMETSPEEPELPQFEETQPEVKAEEVPA